MSLKKHGWTTEEKWKRVSFSYCFLRSHADSHSYTLCYFTQGKKWLQKSFSQKPLRKLLQWRTNTLGVPSSQERDFFFLMGNISYSKHQNLSCGQHPKKALLDLPASSNQRTDTGVCTPACKDFRVNVHQNRRLLPAKLQGVCKKDFYCLLGTGTIPPPPTSFN